MSVKRTLLLGKLEFLWKDSINVNCFKIAVKLDMGGRKVEDKALKGRFSESASLESEFSLKKKETELEIIVYALWELIVQDGFLSENLNISKYKCETFHFGVNATNCALAIPLGVYIFMVKLLNL